MDRVSIKKHAKEQIQGKIFSLLAIYLVIIAASWIISLVLGPIAWIIDLIVAGPIAYAMASIYLGIVKKSTVPQIEDILTGFKQKQFTRTLVTYVRYEVFILLWGLLFIIPGIIKAIAYSQMFYLIADDDKLEPGDAQKKSMEMMEGHKAEYFVMLLSFIPWILLCIVTFGIASIYVKPYVEATLAEFHVQLVKENKPSTKIAKAVAAKATEVKEKVTAKKSAAKKNVAKKPTTKKTTSKKK